MGVALALAALAGPLAFEVAAGATEPKLSEPTSESKEVMLISLVFSLLLSAGLSFDACFFGATCSNGSSEATTGDSLIEPSCSDPKGKGLFDLFDAWNITFKPFSKMVV